MKKYIICNTAILIAIFLVVCAGTIGLYFYANNLLVKQTISVNLKAIGDTVNDTIEIKMQNDKYQLENFLKGIPGESETEVVAYANAHFSEVSLSTEVEGGFGRYIDNRQATYYLIDNIRYMGINSSFNPEYERQEIAICNFYLNYQSYENNATSTKVVNKFSDKYYIVFKLENNYIAYIEAEPYFNFITESMEKASIEKYYIIGEDGIVIYQQGSLRAEQFYDILRNAKNSETDVEKILNDIKTDDSGLVYENILLDDNNHFITISNLTKFEGEKSKYDLHVVLLLSDEKISIFTKPISTSLIAIVVFLNLFCCGLCVLSYFLALRKYHIIDKFAAFSNKKDVFAIQVNPQGKILAINAAFKNTLFNPKNYKSIIDFAFKGEEIEPIKEMLAENELLMHLDFEDAKKGEELYIRFITVRNFFNYILIGIDVTEEEKRNEKLLHVALYNTETELPNTYLLEEELEKTFTLIKEHPLDGIKAVLVAFDIENFNNFNVLFGEYMGGKVLREIATMVNKSLENTKGQLYLVKNSTFMVYFYDIENMSVVENWIKDTLVLFKQPVKIDENVILINLYFGILSIDFNQIFNLTSSLAIDFVNRTLQKVMSFANKRYDFFDLSISNFVSSEKLLEQDLINAIEKQEFRMYLQPQYDNEKNRICGFESLIRWDNPKYRGQSPAHFIEVAERNSLIVQIGKFIFAETFRLAKELEPYDITISVNISPVQLFQAGFTSEIIETANRIGVNPHKIAIEITETFLMENFKEANEKLTYLRNHGFLIHLDDFGTGYSSLLYIKELKVDAIKIDREFTKNLNNDQYSRIIVSKIIGIAKSLDLDIIAEGVEDDKQNSFLQKNGCNIIQGYWISRAASYEDAIKLLEKYNVKKEKVVIPDEAPKRKRTTNKDNNQ